jgi:hypothetical protein
MTSQSKARCFDTRLRLKPPRQSAAAMVSLMRGRSRRARLDGGLPAQATGNPSAAGAAAPVVLGPPDNASDERTCPSRASSRPVAATPSLDP